MTEVQQQPGTLPWVQFRENMLTARESHRKAAIDAVRRLSMSIQWSADSLGSRPSSTHGCSCARTWFPRDLSSVARSCAAWANWCPAHRRSALGARRQPVEHRELLRREPAVMRCTVGRLVPFGLVRFGAGGEWNAGVVGRDVHGSNLSCGLLVRRLSGHI